MNDTQPQTDMVLDGCPLCDTLPRVIIVDGWYRITCPTCGCSVTNCLELEASVRIWNTRASNASAIESAVKEATAPLETENQRLRDAAQTALHRLQEYNYNAMGPAIAKLIAALAQQPEVKE